MYEIIIEPPAERFIKKLSKEQQNKTINFIEKLSENPHKGKRLVGNLKGLRSLRLDNIRIIYKLEEVKLIILVLRAGYRANIYS